MGHNIPGSATFLSMCTYRVEMKSCEVYKYQQDNSCSMPASTCRVSCGELLMFIKAFASIILFKMTSVPGQIFLAIQFSSFDS